MENLQNFQDEVKRQVCAFHHMSPSFQVIDGRMELKCCCTDFKIRCYTIIIQALSEYYVDRPVRSLRVVYRKDPNGQANC